MPISLVSCSPINVPSPIFLLIVSPFLLFQCPSSFSLLFLLISFLLSSLTVTRVVLNPVMGQLLHLSITPTTTFPIFLLTISLLLLFQFLYGLVSYFPHSVLLISILARKPTMKFLFFFLPGTLNLLFQFSSYVFFIFKFPHRLLSLGILFTLQSSPNSPLIPNSPSH